MPEDLDKILCEVHSLKELDLLQSQYLGKNSSLASEFAKLAKVEDLSMKSSMGIRLNEARKKISDSFKKRRLEIEDTIIQKKLSSESLDVTLPPRNYKRGGFSLISSVISEVLDILASMGFESVSGPEIEDEFHVFDALNSPEHHPAREMQDSFYLRSGKMLRTHTSSVQIRAMEQHKSNEPIRIASAGKVYRKDWDATHTPMFHQIEGLYIDDKVSMSNLKFCMEKLLNEFFDKVKVRFRPSFFPFTEPSAEVDILGKNGWVEILGCGIVHKKVLDNVDIKNKSGFAFGIGVERLVMLKYGLTDIRKLFNNDFKWLKLHNKMFI